MYADGVVKVVFGGAHFDGDCVSLRDFTRVGTQVMESDNAIVFRSVAYQLV